MSTASAPHSPAADSPSDDPLAALFAQVQESQLASSRVSEPSISTESPRPPTRDQSPSTPSTPSIESIGTGRHRSFSTFNNDTSPEEPSSMSPTATPAISNLNVAHIAQRVKRARKLGAQAETDVDIFLAVSSRSSARFPRSD